MVTLRIVSRDRLFHIVFITLLATKNDEWHSISGDVLKRLRSQIHEESQKANFWRLLSTEREVEIRLCASDFSLLFSFDFAFTLVFFTQIENCL